jgi:hypothetical protein
MTLSLSLKSLIVFFAFQNIYNNVLVPSCDTLDNNCS